MSNFPLPDTHVPHSFREHTVQHHSSDMQLNAMPSGYEFSRCTNTMGDSS